MTSTLSLFPVETDYLRRRIYPALQTLLAKLGSPQSRKSYRLSLDRFFAWHAVKHPGEMMSRASVYEYRASLQDRGLSGPSINVNLATIRSLALEAAAARPAVIPEEIAVAITRVENLPKRGRRQGVWLTAAQAETAIGAEPAEGLAGKRDRALRAVAIGCGLRRYELAELTVEHVRELWGRPAIVDLRGKGNKLRSIPMPCWAHAAVREWIEASGLSSGALFPRFNCQGEPQAGHAMAPDSIGRLVKRLLAARGLDAAAHDLRRTYAKLARKGGATLDQLQLSLGHADIRTTMLYVGDEQDFEDAPCDHLPLFAQTAGSPGARAAPVAPATGAAPPAAAAPLPTAAPASPPAELGDALAQLAAGHGNPVVRDLAQVLARAIGEEQERGARDEERGRRLPGRAGVRCQVSGFRKARR